MWWEPKQAHPATSRQTSETADYNPVAPSTGVPTAGRKTPGAVRRSAAVLVESKGGPHPNTAPRSPWSYQQGQRAPVPGCCAEDAFPAPAPQARGRKTIQPDSEKSRASPNCPRCLTAKRIIQNDSRRPVFQQTARALRSFIFHANQWLIRKALRQAPARPAYTRRPRCTADIFCNLAWWRETYFRGLLVRPFRA